MIGNPNLVNDLIPESILSIPFSRLVGNRIAHMVFYRYIFLFGDNISLKDKDFSRLNNSISSSNLTLGNYLQLRKSTNFIPKLGSERLDLCDSKVNKLIRCSKKTVNWLKFCEDENIKYVDNLNNDKFLDYLLFQVQDCINKYYGDEYIYIFRNRIIKENYQGLSHKLIAQTLKTTIANVQKKEKRLKTEFYSMLTLGSTDKVPVIIFNECIVDRNKKISDLMKIDGNYFNENDFLYHSSRVYNCTTKCINQHIPFLAFIFNKERFLPDGVKKKIPVY
tara:strand:+ start:641 stop:1474 length:834 start_codon:yes stop_codon:yes gene_type:complete